MSHSDSAGCYHGYAATNLSAVNPYFGTQADLQALIVAAHARDIWVMLDVVPNHMGNDLGHDEWKGFSPFNSASDYHPYCLITNYNNQTMVELCRIGVAQSSLVDLDTESQSVVNTLTQWVSDTVQKYQLDGIRIDSVKNVRKTFWPIYVKAAQVFVMGEVAGMFI